MLILGLKGLKKTLTGKWFHFESPNPVTKTITVDDQRIKLYSVRDCCLVHIFDDCVSNI